MGRHKLYRTKEELREMANERQRRYYEKNKGEINRLKMQRYYERKKQTQKVLRKTQG